jgi:hypothetical protein
MVDHNLSYHRNLTPKNLDTDKDLKRGKHPKKYHSTLSDSTLTIIFLKMLEKNLNDFFQAKNIIFKKIL